MKNNKEIFVDHSKIATIKRVHGRKGMKPAKLFRMVIKYLLTKRLLLTDGISATGTRGCVGIPSKISSNNTLSKWSDNKTKIQYFFII